MVVCEACQLEGVSVVTCEGLRVPGVSGNRRVRGCGRYPLWVYVWDLSV